MSSSSGFFPNLVVGNLRPVAQVLQWRKNRPDPTGFRHIESGLFVASAKVGNVGGFTAQNKTLNLLDFGETVANDASGFNSNTTILTVNLGELNSNPNSFFNALSGAADNFKLFNVRFWMPDKSVFNALSGADFYYKTFETWQRGLSLNTSTPGILVVPSSLPDTFNIRFRNQTQFASGAFTDGEFSNFIYLFGNFTGMPSSGLGTYDNNFKFRFTYDWTDQGAEVLPGDAIPCIEFEGLPEVVAPSGGSINGAGNDLFDGMGGFWNMDENSPRLDFGTEANHLLDPVGVPQGSGVSVFTQHAAQFISNSGHYLYHPDDPTLEIGSGEDFTLTAWVYMDTKEPIGTIVSKWGSTLAHQSYKLEYIGGSTERFRFSVGGASGVSSVDSDDFGSPAKETWHFVQAWFDNTRNKINIRVDNGSPNARFHFQEINQGSGDFVVGANVDKNGNFWNGRIDALGLWNKLLSTNELSTLYFSNAGRQWAFGEQNSGLASGIEAGYWMNERAGQTRFDRVQKNNLSDNNTVLRNVGVVGSGAEFIRSSTHYLNASNADPFEIADNNWVLSTWVKLRDKGSDSVIASRWGGSSGVFMLWYDSTLDEFAFKLNGPNNEITQVSSSGFKPASGLWYNVAAQHHRDLNEIQLYVNGSGYFADFGDTVNNTSTNDFVVGGQHGGAGHALSGMNGCIDSVHIWRRPLIQDEFTQLYNMGSGVEWKFLSKDVAPIPSLAPASGAFQTGSGLLSYWKLDEVTGTRYDMSGPHHMGDNNTVQVASGVTAHNHFAAKFERANEEYLSRSGANAPEMSFGDISFMFCGWVQIASKNTQAILSKWGSSTNEREYLLDYNSGTDRFRFGITSDGTNFTNITVSANNLGSPSTDTWYFVVAWHDPVNNVIGIQVNDGTADTAAATAGVFQGDAAFEIGELSVAAGFEFDGLIDALGVWTRILTTEERTALYNEGLGLQHPFGLQTELANNIEAAWLLNEYTGDNKVDRINKRELVDHNNATRIIGLIGSGTRFNASFDQWLDVSSDSGLQVGSNNFTLGTRVRVFKDVDMTLVQKKDEYELNYNKDTNGLDFVTYNGGSPTTVQVSGYGDVVNTWHSVMCWIASGTINIEVNGSGAQSTAFAGPVDTTAGKFVVGSGCNADIDGLHLWNVLVPPTQRTEFFRECNEYPFFTALNINCPPVGSGAAPAPPPDPPVNGIPTGSGSTIFENLLEYYKMDEATNSRRKSAPGINTMAQINGPIVRNSGVSIHTSFAAEFDGVNQYCQSVDNAQHSAGPNKSFSIAGWFYMDDKAADYPLVSKWDAGSNQREYLLRYDQSEDLVQWFLSDNGTNVTQVDASGSVSAATWHFYVADYNSSNNVGSLQIDNGLISSGVLPGDVHDGTSIFQVGATSTSSEFLNGRADAVGFWDKVLSLDERAFLYNSGSGLQYPFGKPQLTAHSGCIIALPLNETGARFDRIADDRFMSSVGSTASVAGKVQHETVVGSGTEINRTGLGRLEIASASDFQLVDKARTFAAWTKLKNKTNSSTVFSKWDSLTSDREYKLEYNQTQDLWVFSCQNTLSGLETGVGASGVTPAVDTWYFIVGWHDPDADAITIQVDNGKRYSEVFAGGSNAGSAEFTIGALDDGLGGSSTNMDGFVDAVHVWDRILTAEEVRDIYNNGSGLEYPFVGVNGPSIEPNADEVLASGLFTNMLSFWNFDETSGEATDSHGFNDLSASGVIGSGTGVDGNFTSTARILERANSENFWHVDNDDLSIGQNTRTWNGWFYLESKPAGQTLTLLGKTDPTAANQEFHLNYNVNADQLVWTCRNFANTANVGITNDNGGAGFALNTWYMVKAGYDFDEGHTFLQVNDGPEVSGILSGGVRNNVIDYLMGVRNGNSATYFDGRFDAWGLWSRVLSSGECDFLYNGGSGQQYPFGVQPNPLATPPTSGDIVSTNLVSWWHLEEPAGTNREDSVNNNDLTDTNSNVVAVSGLVEKCANFNGEVNEILTINDNTSLSPAVSLSISAWVYMTEKDEDRQIVNKYLATGDERSYKLYYDSTNDVFAFAISTDGESGGEVIVRATDFGSPQLRTWYHVVGVADGNAGEIRVTVNGFISNVNTYSSTIHDGTAALRIGLGADTLNPWDGKIDEVGFWNKPLASGEISFLYNSGKGVGYPFTNLNPERFVAPSGGFDSLPSGAVMFNKMMEINGIRYDSFSNKHLSEESASVGRSTGPHTAFTPSGALFTGATNQCLKRTDEADISFNHDDFTFSVWALIEDKTADRTIFSKFDSVGNNREYSLDYDTLEDKFRWTVTHDGGITSSGIVYSSGVGHVQENNWYHIVAGHDSVENYLTIQVNTSGNVGEQAKQHYSAGIHDGTAGLCIGLRDDSTTPWDGTISHFGLWNKVLGSGEVTALYDEGRGAPTVHARGTTNSTLASGLVGFWTMDEVTGTNYHDSFGGFTMGANNTPTTTVGPSGGIVTGSGIDFERDNTEFLDLTAARSADFVIGNSPFTWAAWVRLESKPGDMVFAAKDDISLQRSWNIGWQNSSDRFRFAARNSLGTFIGRNADNLGSPSLDTWYLVFWGYDPGAGEIFVQVNDLAVETVAFSNPPIDNSNVGLTFGKINSVSTPIPLDGSMDSVGAWNRLLTDTEKTELYNEGRGLTYPFPFNPCLTADELAKTLHNNIEGYWNLNENSGPRRDFIKDKNFTVLDTVTQVSGVSSTTSFAADIASGRLISNFNLPPDRFTLAGWFRPSGATGSILKKEGSFELSWASNTLTFETNQNGSNVVAIEASGAIIDTDQWHFVSVWLNNETGNIGVEVNAASGASAAVGYSMTQNGHPVVFGSGTSPVNVDSWGLWSVRLSDDMRSCLYNNGVGRNYPFGNFSTLSNGLLGYWRNEGTHDIIEEDTNNGILTDSGGTKVQAHIGSGVQFASASTERWTHADDALFEIADNDRTMAFWVNMTTKSADMVIAAKNDGTNSDWQLLYNQTADRFRFAAWNGGVETTVNADNLGSPSTDTWYLIVIKHDPTANTISIQVNNGTANSTGFTGGTDTDGAVFSLGARSDGSLYFNGIIDDWAIWNRLLTAGELTTLYSNGNGIGYPFL